MRRRLAGWWRWQREHRQLTNGEEARTTHLPQRQESHGVLEGVCRKLSGMCYISHDSQACIGSMWRASWHASRRALRRVTCGMCTCVRVSWFVDQGCATASSVWRGQYVLPSPLDRASYVRVRIAHAHAHAHKHAQAACGACARVCMIAIDTHLTQCHVRRIAVTRSAVAVSDEWTGRGWHQYRLGAATVRRRVVRIARRRAHPHLIRRQPLGVFGFVVAIVDGHATDGCAGWHANR